MSNSNNYTWHSGDWNAAGNNPQPPYNGLQISAVANYSSPPSVALLSVDVMFTDFTYDPNGVSSTVTLFQPGSWQPIPIPVNDKALPQEPDPNFTVCGNLPSEPGMIRLDPQLSGLFLNVQFRYGVKDFLREEIGYILKIDPNGNHTEVEA